MINGELAREIRHLPVFTEQNLFLLNYAKTKVFCSNQYKKTGVIIYSHNT
jgi:hypothetical protein